jgi:tripartite ATP-independent transporter DctM subunit
VAIFSAISGSSTACAATFGTVAIPELERRGFERRMIYGALAAGATLDIMIPPSVTMIIYGAMTEQSVGRLFLAGLLPGIVLTLLFCAYIIGVAIVKPEWCPRAESYTWRERLYSIKDLVPASILIVIVLGGIYLGWFTPTEAAAIGAFAAMLLALAHRQLTWRVFEDALLDAARTTSMIMIIVVSALFAGHVITKVGLPLAIGEAIRTAGLSPWAVFVIICLIYLVLGCLIDSVSMIVMTLPVVYPIMSDLGFDLIWFGIVLVALVELSLITPPVGLNLYVIHGLTKGRPISDVFLGSAPYVGLLIIGIGLLVLWPDLALWLPRVLMSR